MDEFRTVVVGLLYLAGACCGFAVARSLWRDAGSLARSVSTAAAEGRRENDLRERQLELDERQLELDERELGIRERELDEDEREWN